MRVFFITLSRSDYASLMPVARAALADEAIDGKLIVGGSHLLARYGRTVEQVEKDGLSIYQVAAFLRESDDSAEQLAEAYARALTGFVRFFAEDMPDAVFLVGDRWEMLAVATAASLLGIPIIHHSGGDITQGSADNQTRYAITCLAHLHLVALPEHRERLLHMGEEDWRVITTGEPALCELSRLASSEDARQKLGLAPDEAFVLATFHPTSFDPLPPEQQVEVFLKGIEGVADTIILTAPNPDASSKVFFDKLKAFAEAHSHVKLFESLGGGLYYAAMAQAKYMIGNSSSGLWEAPSFRLPVVNIGPRQQGRVHGDNVVNAPLEAEAIKTAIGKVDEASFRAGLKGENPYVRPDTLELILGAIKVPHDRQTLLAKRFVDPLRQA